MTPGKESLNPQRGCDPQVGTADLQVNTILSLIFLSYDNKSLFLFNGGH